MKNLVAGLIVLAAGSTFACPNLAGTYACPGENGATIQTVITQADASGVTTYEMTDDQGTAQYIADGLTRTAAGKSQNGNDVVVSITNTCVGAALALNANYVEKDASGATVVDALVKQNVSLDASSNLVIAGSITQSGAEQPFQGTCLKQ